MARPPGRLLVDGSNVAWAWAPVRTLLLREAFGPAQRLLVERIVGAGLVPPGACVVVFDGPPPPGGPAPGGPVLVRYPDPGQSGDDRLLELVGAHAHGRGGVQLVTNDRLLRETARHRGATTTGAGALLDRLDPDWRAGRHGPAAPDGPGERKPAPTPGDTAEWLRRFGARGGPGGGRRRQGVDG